MCPFCGTRKVSRNSSLHMHGGHYHPRCPCPSCKVWTVVHAFTFYKDPSRSGKLNQKRGRDTKSISCRYLRHDYILLEGYNSPIDLANAPRLGCWSLASMSSFITPGFGSCFWRLLDLSQWPELRIT